MLTRVVRSVAGRSGVVVSMSNSFSTDLPKALQKKLFTPGPLNTSMPVKEAMLRDLGSRDAEFLRIIKTIRQKVVEIGGVSTDVYTCVPLQGTGTYSVEGVFQSAIPRSEKRNVLILENGSYGKRMAKICQSIGIAHQVLSFPEDSRVDVDTVRKTLGDGKNFSMVAVVHSETSSGLINPIKEIGDLLAECGPTRPLYFIDAMSSYGAFPISLANSPIDFLVSSANKCIEGVPGFSYAIARIESLKKCKGNSRSLCLDLYDQWVGLEQTKQFRFTPPTHSMLAFAKALEQYAEEGGVEGRRRRYMANRQVLRDGMARLGFKEYLVAPEMTPDSYIITAYLYPKDPAFNFTKLYQELSDRGQIIYPGKVLDADCFRLGSIGNLYPADFVVFLQVLEQVLKEMGVALPVRY